MTEHWFTIIMMSALHFVINRNLSSDFQLVNVQRLIIKSIIIINGNVSHVFNEKSNNVNGQCFT